jgi:predicted aspartyl protease
MRVSFWSVPFAADLRPFGARPPAAACQKAANSRHSLQNPPPLVNVDVDVADYPLKATVDTGCSFPMSIPQALADALIKRGLAVKAGTTPSMLADGKVSDVGVILIGSITVAGRTLDTVEPSVSPGTDAPILLGLGALNRLGTFKIEEGSLVFTGEQPA